MKHTVTRRVATGALSAVLALSSLPAPAIAEAAGISKKQAAAAYDALLQIAYAGAKLPKGLMLPGLGKILKAKRKARVGLNPLTKEKIKIPAKTVAKFRLCKAAKEAVLK
jgi:DNA-binding protein HU-beta